jgi:hypothetical protein
VAEKLVEQEPIKVLVTERPESPKDGEKIKTPAGSPDLVAVTRTWYAQVGVRVLRTYLQSLVGFVLAVGSGAAGGVGINIQVGDFGDLMLKSAGLAVAPAMMSLLQNAIEILTSLDQSHPQARA